MTETRMKDRTQSPKQVNTLSTQYYCNNTAVPCRMLWAEKANLYPKLPDHFNRDKHSSVKEGMYCSPSVPTGLLELLKRCLWGTAVISAAGRCCTVCFEDGKCIVFLPPVEASWPPDIHRIGSPCPSDGWDLCSVYTHGGQK